MVWRFWCGSLQLTGAWLSWPWLPTCSMVWRSRQQARRLNGGWQFGFALELGAFLFYLLLFFDLLGRRRWWWKEGPLVEENVEVFFGGSDCS